ncbi:type VI secretion system tube protein TssD, partial [Escherichia coli]|uniref:type VI secretion system tube protein TssD n=1 Tax=Escherichia coli TaxID=562 RepID=UPI000AF85DDC
SHWSTSKTPSYTKSVSWQHHRTSKAGIYQPYYKINLSKARISSIDFVTPHAVLEKELEPQERIAFIYEDISWEHTLAGTNAMSKWQDRVQ